MVTTELRWPELGLIAARWLWSSSAAGDRLSPPEGA